MAGFDIDEKITRPTQPAEFTLNLQTFQHGNGFIIRHLVIIRRTVAIGQLQSCLGIFPCLDFIRLKNGRDIPSALQIPACYGIKLVIPNKSANKIGGANDSPERIAASLFLRRAYAIHAPMDNPSGKIG